FHNKTPQKLDFFCLTFGGQFIISTSYTMRFSYLKYFLLNLLYSMKIKVQTRKLASGCSKQCFEVADGS
ncbi:hypothetical protein, partial [Streptococcus pneumoniae]|uniref:hypothetical protein n=1 Tax=Streptococcus pneumoniae TaxID=1313 RepID=UPI001C930135